jgi:hypothetical protein
MIMSNGSVIIPWIGAIVAITLALSQLSHAARTDPAAVVHEGHVAVHGIVIPPFNR